MKSELSKEEQEIVNEVALVIFALLKTIETATWNQLIETVNAQPVVVRKINALYDSERLREGFSIGVAMKLIRCGKVELKSADGILMKPRQDGQSWQENDFKVFV
ncbi:MAG: hypothetical protein ABI758_01270 [Candidatus Woesebacteria bacterium]